MTMLGYKFHFSWQKTLLTILALCIFISLGFWQLDRARKKTAMLKANKSFQALPVLDFAAAKSLKEPAQYQPLKVKGYFLPKILLLDNQYYNHKLGYDVISPLQLTRNKIVLIDRGWIAADVNRAILPDIINPEEELSLEGKVYYPAKNSWISDKIIERTLDKTLVIEKIDFKVISQILHKPVYPFIIRLNKKSNYGYIREWKIIVLSPRRHKAYAFQWFAIALTIFIIYLSLSFKNENLQ